MVCQNCAIFQSLVQDIVKTCIEKFRRVPKNFVEAWDLFYKESEVKSSRPKSLLQRQETCKLPRIKTIAEDSNMDLSAYPLMTSLDHFIPRTQGTMLKKSEIRIFPDEIDNSGNYNSEHSLFRPLIEKPRITGPTKTKVNQEVRRPNSVEEDSYDDDVIITTEEEDIEPFPFTSSCSSSIEDEFYDSSEEEFLI